MNHKVTDLRNVLLLDFSLSQEGATWAQTPRLERLTFLPELFRKSGINVTYPRGILRADGKVEPNIEARLIESMHRSDAVVMFGTPKGLYSKAIFEALEARILEGMRVWTSVPMLLSLENEINLGWPIAAWYQRLLELIGVELTHVGLFTSKQVDFDHPRVLTIERASSPSSFRHPELFRGVDKIVLIQAQGLRLHGEAQSIAAANPHRFDVVDTERDRFCDWNEPDVAVMSASYLGDRGGCVVATSGLPDGDPFSGAFGHRFPGSDINEKLLRNLLSFLTRRAEGNRDLSNELVVHRLVQSIERVLLETVRNVLSAVWPDCLSQKIRERAVARAEHENSGIPWWAYLDLSDHVNTLTTFIDRFAPALEKANFPVSKRKVQSEVLCTGSLVRLRILDSHITKRIVTEHEFSQSDLETLELIYSNTVRLWKAAVSITATT